LKNTLKNDNKLFFKFIFPSKELIRYSIPTSYEKLDIKFLSGNIFGDIGSGKTNLVRTIIEEAVKKYGESNVNGVIEPNGNILRIMRYGLKNKLVNILFSDDITLRDIQRESLRLYFKIRHLQKELYGIDNGYILSLLGLHRFHSTFPELKNPQFLVVTSYPSNPFDESLTKRFIGEDGMELLMDIEKNRVDNPEYKKYSIYWLKTGDVGLLNCPLAVNDYMRVI